MPIAKIWLDYDQEALDAQYNNQRTVADYAAVVQDWAEASTAARSACQWHEFSYGSHPRASLDFYPSDGGGPAVIFFHGGFWRSFDKTGIAFLAPAFVGSGISLVLPNYPLAPEAGMATIVAHAAQAADWIFEHAEVLKIDRSKLWIGGHSAGAHLAVMTAVSFGADARAFAGCFAISGVYDLEPIRLSYLNDALHLSQADVSAWSPIRRKVAATPFIAAVGDQETDEFRRQTTAMIHRLQAADGECRDEVLRYTDHYEAVRRLARPGDTLFRQLAAAVRGEPAPR